MKTDTTGSLDSFLHAPTCKHVLLSFYALCESISLEYPPAQNEKADHCTFYTRLKKKLHSSWKAQSLFNKLDKHFMGKDYFIDGKIPSGRIAEKLSVLIIGAGPCGLRSAIEMSLLGAKTVVVEKRDAFSRNNVLHLWPFNITDLKAIGAKKFFGRFCAGAIDHISIRQLQLLLLKSTLVLGVEVHVETSFLNIIPPTVDDKDECGWRALVEPKTSPVSLFNFDVVVGADGKRNTLEGFKRKCFRGKPAIGITANFINMRTAAEASVEEISGVAYIFNQQFFKDLNEKTRIDLENIVYYKDDTHYFVMTAKKHSLLKKGVLIHDHDSLEKLLSHKNVDQKALMTYAREAASFSTNYKLPNMKFAVNSYGQPDVAVFDFTAMYAAENATMFKEVNGYKLLCALVGDSLLEPFWPLGTGCARGFFAAFDTAWMVRSWCEKLRKNNNPKDNTIELEVLQEREAIYRLLHQTTPDNISKNIHSYTINPTSRYPKINYNTVTIHQVKSLYIRDLNAIDTDHDYRDNSVGSSSLTRNVSFIRSNKLLAWCRTILKDYKDINVTNMAQSWRDGIALCGIIHRYRPDLIPIKDLDPKNVEQNNQLAFDVAEQHFGITPVLSGKEMAESTEVDNLLMITYLSQFYEIFKKESPPPLQATKSQEVVAKTEEDADDKEPVSPISSTSPVGLLTRFTQKIKRKSNPKKSYNLDKKRKNGLEVATEINKKQSVTLTSSTAVKKNEKSAVSSVLNEAKNKLKSAENNDANAVIRRSNSFKADVHQRASNRISSLGLQLISKFEQNSDANNHTSSKVCHFCQKSVYILERNSVEGVFFHRNCFVCVDCGASLRTTNYKRIADGDKFFCETHYTEYLKSIDAAETKTDGAAESKPLVYLYDSGDDEHSEEKDDVVTPMVEIPSSNVVLRPKRTPERIELENMRLSMVNFPNEISEEDLNELNFSQSIANDPETDDDSDSSDTDDSFYMDAMDDGTSSQDLLTSYHEKLSKNALLKESRKSKSKHNSHSTIDEEESFLSNTLDDGTELLLSSETSTETEAELLDDEVCEELENEAIQVTVKEPSPTPIKDFSKSSPKQNILLSAIADISSCNLIKPVHPSPPLTKKSMNPEKKKKVERVLSSEFNIKTFKPYLANTMDENEDINKDKTSIIKKNEEELIHSPSMDKVQNYITSHPVMTEQSEKPNETMAENSNVNAGNGALEQVENYSVPLDNIEQPCSSNTSVSSYSSQDSVSVSSYHSDEDNDTFETTQIVNDSTNTTKEAETSLNESKSSTDSFGAYKPSWEQRNYVARKPSRTVKPQDKMTFEFMQKRQKKRLQVRRDWFENDQETDFLTPQRNVESKGSESDMYFTPSAETPNKCDETMFFSFNTTEVDSNSAARTEAPTSSGKSSFDSTNRRKLPTTPGKKKLPPLPKIRYFERLHSTSQDDSTDDVPSSVEKDLLRHEARVKARIEKMKTALKKDEIATSTPLPRDNSSNFLDSNKSSATKETPKKAARRKPLPTGKLKIKKPLFSPKKKRKWKSNNKSYDAANDSLPSSSYDKRSVSLTDDLEERISKKVQIAALKLEKMEKHKRLRRAHLIQRQLEEVEVKQRQLEKRGVELETTIRRLKSTENSLDMQEWFKIVQERNGLLRYENELMIYQRELQLEDRQSKLKDDWRALIVIPHAKKNSEIYAREKEVLKELLEVVQQRDELVGLLDEERQKDRKESSDVESIMLNKFSNFNDSDGVFVV